MEPADLAGEKPLTGENNLARENPLAVVFMGTPEFAVSSLRALVERASPGQLWPGGLRIAGVVTRPDTVTGRGREKGISPVKRYALEQGIGLFQPGSLRRPDAQRLMRELAPDLIVVAAFGQILPREVLELPRYGCLNVHASLLPRHRGASPIPAAILAGDRETGVTIMLMDEGLDTGPVLARRATHIGSDSTAGSLFERLAVLGAETLVETLPLWLLGAIVPEPQDPSRATLTHVLTKEDGLLGWNNAAVALERAVRAYFPWPGAYSTWNGQLLKVLKAHVLSPEKERRELSESLPPGTCFLIGSGARDRSLACVCGAGSLALDVIQLPGKRALPSAEVLRGHPELAGALLGS